MDRRDTVLALLAFGAAAPAARAQQPTKVARIGFLALDMAGNPRGMDSFRQGLHDIGYVEGRNVVVEVRDAARNLERLPVLAAELAGLKVDVIAAPSVFAAQAAHRATKTIPIVFAGVADPVTDGLVASLARPGGNVTGLSNLAPELVGKHLELIKQAVPGAIRVAILWQPGGGMESTDRDTLKQAEVAARAQRLQLQVVEARSSAEFDKAFSEMVRTRTDALCLLGTPMFYVERVRLAQMAARSRLPSVFASKLYVDAGGLMSYGASLSDLLRRSATYIDKILKGAKPADLPVEQPTKFELVINLKAAQALGITIPQSLLWRADEVIQ